MHFYFIVFGKNCNNESPLLLYFENMPDLLIHNIISCRKTKEHNTNQKQKLAR